MGCDIHLYCEKKNEKGEWEIVKGKNFKIEQYREWAKGWRVKGEEERANHLEKQAADIESGTLLVKSLKQLNETYPSELRKKDPDLQKEYESEVNSITMYYSPETPDGFIYSGRNYNLFAILADVRNGYGFAGIETGDGFNPISDPRGVPEDASPEYKAIVKQWGEDGHSHSYHTLAQLLAYNWSQKTKSRGIVGVQQYKSWKATGLEPNFYSGHIWGGNIVQVSNYEMDKLIANNSFQEGKEYYTEVEWTNFYFEASELFYNKSLEKLKALSKDGKGEDIRIVFFFDN